MRLVPAGKVVKTVHVVKVETIGPVVMATAVRVVTTTEAPEVRVRMEIMEVRADSLPVMRIDKEIQIPRADVRKK